MFEAPPNKKMSIRIIRDGEEEAAENEWKDSSPEERIEAVWTLTRLCLAWNNHLTNEPRLQRTVTRIQRSSRWVPAGWCACVGCLWARAPL